MCAAAAVKINPKLVSGGLLAAAGVLLLGDCFYTVQGGHRAVVFSKITGVSNRTSSEGLHLKFPFIHTPVIFDVRTKAQTLNSATGSKDLQIVNVSLRILSKPRIEALPNILQTIGVNYDQKVLPSIGNEVLKCVVAQFNASQLITMRQQVSEMIKEHLTERSKDFNIMIEDIAIVDMTFGREYTQAIEAKQIAQQEAQRAMFVVEQAIQEKQQKIVQAEGEAESVTLLGEAVQKNPGYLKLRRIRAAQKIANIISESPNKLYLDADSLMLNLADLSNKN